MRTVPPKGQNEHQRTDKFQHPSAHLEYMSSEINRPFIATSANGHYENVPRGTTQCGFVTNDIYETCRNPSAVEAGWVDNDIYGY